MTKKSKDVINDDVPHRYKDIPINSEDEYKMTTKIGDEVSVSDKSVFDKHMLPIFNPDMETLSKWFAARFPGHYCLETLDAVDIDTGAADPLKRGVKRGTWFRLHQNKDSKDGGLQITFEVRHTPGKGKTIGLFDCTGIAETLARALEMYGVAGAMANRNDWNKMIADLKQTFFKVEQVKKAEAVEPDKFLSEDTPAEINMRTIRDTAALLETLADNPATLSKNASAVKSLATLIKNIASDKNPQRELFGLNLRHA